MRSLESSRRVRVLLLAEDETAEDEEEDYEEDDERGEHLRKTRALGLEVTCAGRGSRVEGRGSRVEA